MWPDADPLTPYQWLLTVVALVGFAGAGYALLPALLSFLGLTRVRFRPTDDPAAGGDEPGDERYAALHRALADDGFQPAGVVDECVWFQGHEWTFRARV